jgi:DNA-directed RNA polymerase subunit RPC12/RpoP
MNVQQMGEKLPMNFSLNDTRDIQCGCGNTIFMPGYRFKKVSRLITGGAKDSILPIELYLCTMCSTPLQELLPEELKNKTVETKNIIE